jgi:peptidoglycan hydrolase CwlO-like protein
LETEVRKVEAQGRPGQARARRPKRHPSTPAEARSKAEIRAYSSLRAKGVSDQAIMRWERVMARSGLTPGAVQSELIHAQNLSKLEGRVQARLEKVQQALEKIQAKHDEMRKKYSSAWDSVMRYQLLREEGVDGAVLQRWEKLIAGNGLDPQKVEDELLSLRSLDQSKKELQGRLAELEAKEVEAKAHVKVLEEELSKLDSQRTELLKSIDSVAKSVQSMSEGAAKMMGKASDEAGENLKKVSEGAQAKLAATAATLDGFKAKLEEAYALAFSTGETIGKYEALRPLVKFVESGEGKPGEVIPLMSLLTRTLAKWAKDGDPVLQAKARDLEAYLDEKLRMA